MVKDVVSFRRRHVHFCYLRQVFAMSGPHPSEQLPELSALVEEITALAEHAKVHGAVRDCGARMDALIARHRARIEAARRVEAEEAGSMVVSI